MKSSRKSLLLAALISTVISSTGWVVFLHMRHVDFGATPIIWHTKGSSMLPAIRSGDEEIAGGENFLALKPGSIVIFHPDGNWTTSKVVCHRIVTEVDGKWITRGDNNESDDPGFMTQKNYVATVEVIIHRNTRK